jgi:parallel beta-helix repeat protein
VPTPAPVSQTSGPIEVTTDNRVIDGVTITSSGITGAGISAAGTLSNPIDNLTIRNCTIKGFRMGIYLRFVKNVTIQNCTITDADYAGIAIFSGIGGQLSGNTILRIGMTKDPATGFQGNNTYGIMLNRSESSSLTTDPPSQDFMIDHNVVRDVPLWMCLNLHGARNITFSANTTSGCPRAIFIAGSPMSGGGVAQSANVTVTGNRLEPPATKPGGTTDIEGVLIASLQGGKITNNAISRAYNPPVFDYQGVSVNVTISGTTAF